MSSADSDFSPIPEEELGLKVKLLFDRNWEDLERLDIESQNGALVFEGMVDGQVTTAYYYHGNPRLVAKRLRQVADLIDPSFDWPRA